MAIAILTHLEWTPTNYHGLTVIDSSPSWTVRLEELGFDEEFPILMFEIFQDEKEGGVMNMGTDRQSRRKARG